MSALIDRMEKQGLVERKHDLSRKNLVRVVVTPKGEEAFQRQRSMNAVANLTSTLTKEERQALGICVDKLRVRATELIREMTPTPYDY
jgi:DNA-binding MarR family transcriptional regulator